MAEAKKESGAAGRKRRKAEAEAAVAAEPARVELSDEFLERMKAIRDDPMDPIGNSEWANKASRIAADIIARDTTIPLPARIKQLLECIDRIGYTQSKASVSKRIREVQTSAGIPTARQDRQHADGVTEVGRGPALRARRDDRGAATVS